MGSHAKWIPAFLLVSVGALAVGAVIVFFAEPISGTRSRTATNPAQVTSAQANSQATPAKDLAAPHYDPAKPISFKGEAEPVFRNAMAQYQKRDFGAASVLLRQATELSPEAPELRYYLAASFLLTGDTRAAISELKTATRLGDSAYKEAAHLLLARAYMIQRDTLSARESVAQAVSLHGPLEQSALKLQEELAKY